MHALFLQGVTGLGVALSFGSLTLLFSGWSDTWNVRAMSISCSSVGVIAALTSSWPSVLWR